MTSSYTLFHLLVPLPVTRIDRQPSIRCHRFISRDGPVPPLSTRYRSLYRDPLPFHGLRRVVPRGGRISMHTGFGERVIRHRNHVLPRERSSVQIAEASSRLSISLLSVNSLPTGISFRLTIIFSKPRPPPIIPSLFYPTYPSPTKGSGPHNFLLLLSSSREDSSQKSRIALVFQPGGQ